MAIYRVETCGDMRSLKCIFLGCTVKMRNVAAAIKQAYRSNKVSCLNRQRTD